MCDSLDLSSNHTTSFNFLASHDGIGLDPARGIVSELEIVALEGALFSYKNNPAGTSRYEINVTYLDALNSEADDDATRLKRFLLAHEILLVFPGVPAIYIQSLLGSRNHYDGVRATGHWRAVTGCASRFIPSSVS